MLTAAEKTAKRTESMRRWRAKYPDKWRDYARLRRNLGRDVPMSSKCDLCGAVPTGKRGLLWDHCHKTLKFRGWLCNTCNVGIGFVEILSSKVGADKIFSYIAAGKVP